MLNPPEYSTEDMKVIYERRQAGDKWQEIGKLFGKDGETVRQAFKRYRQSTGYQKPVRVPIVQESSYPRYTKPLVYDGDALVLSDTEVPFHHADFINNCLELADKWKMPHCIIAGDVVHLNAFSKWEPNWLEDKEPTISEEAEARIMDVIMDFPEEYQSPILEVLGELPGTTDTSAGAEIEEAGKILIQLAQQFVSMDYVIGNHDGRFLRTLNSEMFPRQLLQILGVVTKDDEDPKWRIGPYYYSILNSGKRKFRVEHPKSAAKITAAKLASKYLCSTIVGHAHQLQWGFDASGTHYAIMAGCCVDEERLPYAAQRSTNADKHKLGAVIVRDGYPYLLHEETQWKRMAKL